jgi:hypothetical protein
MWLGMNLTQLRIHKRPTVAVYEIFRLSISIKKKILARVLPAHLPWQLRYLSGRVVRLVK